MSIGFQCSRWLTTEGVKRVEARIESIEKEEEKEEEEGDGALEKN